MSKTPNNPLWSGRFSSDPDQRFFEFNRSLQFDRRLIFADIQGSMAHVSVLRASGVVTRDEAEALRNGLLTVQDEIHTNPELLEDPSIEDVHSYIEGRLTLHLGDLGRKLHAGRSRNDQVTTATRIWLREQCDAVKGDLKTVLSALVDLANKNFEVVVPGYTHLQRAQPILFAHWALAYVEMFFRDEERLEQLRGRVNVLPLGSGALAGSGLAKAREVAAKELGFASLTANSLDGVSDRDYILDFLSFSSITMMHLSRLAEDMIIYATKEFGFIELGDEVSSGSSLMPQKKNPDALELIRGKSGRVFGSLAGLLATMKGLPMAYNKDLQEDKEALFNAVDTTRACLLNMALVLNKTTVRAEHIAANRASGFMNATDLADLCVEKGMPFREAHEKVGALVRRAIERGVELEGLLPEDFEEVLPGLSESALARLDFNACIESKDAPGGTARLQVQAAIAATMKRLKKSGN